MPRSSSSSPTIRAIRKSVPPQAERLITQEKVAAIIGAYFSNVTATASQVAERYGVPFLNPESSSATLTQRGFKWFFRTTPHDDLFVHNFFDFLKAVETKKGIKPKRIALMNENTLWGTETTKLEDKLGKGARLRHRREGHLSGKEHPA